MTYGVSLARQTYNFFASVGFGFVLGIVYDLFFVIRNILAKRRWVTVLCDSVFVLISSVLSFLLLLVITDGQIRAYVILGEIAGFAVYYFSLGVFIVRICERIAFVLKKIFDFFKRIFIFVFKVISFPFRWIFSVFARLFKKIYEKSRKNAKKMVKKSKYHLHVDNTLLYNQRVYKGSVAHGDLKKKGRNGYRGKQKHKSE